MTRKPITRGCGERGGERRRDELHERHDADRRRTAGLVGEEEDRDPGRVLGGIEGEERQQQQAQVAVANDAGGQSRGPTQVGTARDEGDDNIRRV
jgi:hypothetical protein